MNCRRCGTEDAVYFTGTYDPKNESVLFFHLCPDCQSRFVRSVEGFLGVKE